jgi:hypothetical protein
MPDLALPVPPAAALPVPEVLEPLPEPMVLPDPELLAPLPVPMLPEPPLPVPMLPPDVELLPLPMLSPDDVEPLPVPMLLEPELLVSDFLPSSAHATDTTPMDTTAAAPAVASAVRITDLADIEPSSSLQR